MLAQFFVLAATAQTPKTFEELELAKLTAYHEANPLLLESQVKTTGPDGQPEILKFRDVIDGSRQHDVVRKGAEIQTEYVCDGANFQYIVPTKKIYSESKWQPPAAFDAKSQLLKSPAESFNIQFPLPVLFASDPQLELKSIETVKEGTTEFRKAVCVVTNKSGRTLTVTQWFLPDRWLVKRFSIVGQGKDGPVNVQGTADVIDRKPTIPANEFSLNPASIAGCDKTDIIPPKST